jgi:hypothetical protein
MSTRRTKLVNQAEVHRRERSALTVDGRCRVGNNEPQDVRVTDLDGRGCQIRGFSTGVTKSDPLELWLGPVGPLGARLRWAKRGAIGVAFDEAIDEAVLGQVATVEAQHEVVPLRRNLAD